MLKCQVLGLLAAVIFAVSAFGQGVGPALQNVSVNIKALGASGGAQGSGTVVLRTVDGQPAGFILTAAHVVKASRSVQTVINAEGKETKKVQYQDAQIVQELSTVDRGRTVGERRIDAKVIAADYARDIAWLRLRAAEEFKHSATFYLDKQIPVTGTEILHVGAPGGQQTGGSNTVTSGIVSRTGVRIREFGGSELGIYDQTDTAGLPGSSGGMIALRADGRIIGVLTLGLGGQDSFHWFVPMRNIVTWAEEAKCMWLLDGNGQITEKMVSDIPLELNPPEESNVPSYNTTPAVLPVPPRSFDVRPIPYTYRPSFEP